MVLSFTRPQVVSLKNSPEFSEKWLQERISEDPSILGLGEVELVGTEKALPRAGRLDMLLHDEQLNRRYEVELMLGATDPSHIIRCIEYWDVERRRYPAYDHVAVLVAEDITSRFLNVMALLAGNIPLIALKLSALKVDDKIVLHFTHVLDQTSLRSDDEYELGERKSRSGSQTDRSWWEQRIDPSIMTLCDRLMKVVEEVSGQRYRMQYRRILIDVVSVDNESRRVWCVPKKSLLQIGAYVPSPEEWVRLFEEAGLPATLRRGNKAVRATVTVETFEEHNALLRQFIGEAVTGDSDGASRDSQ